MDLGVGDGDGWGNRVIWLVEEFASGWHADSVGVYFLRSYAVDKVGICDLLVFWNEVSACQFDGDNSFNALLSRASCTYSVGM